MAEEQKEVTTQTDMLKKASSIFDFDKDGDVDVSDLTYGLRKIGEAIWTIITGAVKKEAANLPTLIMGAVLAAAETDGDKRKAAINKVVQDLADTSVQAAIDAGTDEAKAVADHFGIDQNSLDLMITSAVAAARSKNLIR